MMTEHVCEWIAMTLREPISQRGQFFFKCSSHDCPSLLTAPQVATHLNEYDKLLDLLDRLYMNADDEIHHEVFDTLVDKKEGWAPRGYKGR